MIRVVAKMGPRFIYLNILNMNLSFATYCSSKICQETATIHAYTSVRCTYTRSPRDVKVLHTCTHERQNCYSRRHDVKPKSESIATAPSLFETRQLGGVVDSWIRRVFSTAKESAALLVVRGDKRHYYEYRQQHLMWSCYVVSDLGTGLVNRCVADKSGRWRRVRRLENRSRIPHTHTYTHTFTISSLTLNIPRLSFSETTIRTANSW
jgi:hypothetical protein